MSKEEILDGKLNDEELEAVTGGNVDCPSTYQWMSEEEKYEHFHNCVEIWYRNINSPSFPNCAATVEDGSWCKANDACYNSAVSYEGMDDCAKAWR